jgi:hypothetical protein
MSQPMNQRVIDLIKRQKEEGFPLHHTLGLLGVSRIPQDEATYFPKEFKEVYTVNEFLPLVIGKPYRRTILNRLYGEHAVTMAYYDYLAGKPELPRELADIGAQTVVSGPPENTPGGSRKKRGRQNGKKSKSKLHTSRKSCVRRKRH